MMKIALTGAHGTGKSTLASAIQAELTRRKKTSAIIPEVPRMICNIVQDDTYLQRSTSSLLKQSLILLGQLVVEGRNHENIDVKICDRTILDHWAYSLQVFGNEIAAGNYTDIYEMFMLEHCRSYDKIFYLPIEFSLVSDGVREPDEKFQKDMDTQITSIMDKLKISYVTIKGKVEDRCRNILEIMNL